MAAGDAIQIGVEYLVGIGETAYLSHVVTGITYATDADENVHKDARGATDSILTKDPRTTLDITLDMVGLTTDFTPPAKNTVITLKGPDDATAVGYRLTAGATTGSENPAQMTLALIREDSMASVYDA